MAENSPLLQPLYTLNEVRQESELLTIEKIP